MFGLTQLISILMM